MTYESPYGKSEGLAERLLQWADKFGKDRSLPWQGLGLIADLRIAAFDLTKKELEYDL